MKRWLFVVMVTAAVIALFTTTAFGQGRNVVNELVEYEVISINPQNWVVTAKETASGNQVKFRLPPAAFKGRTFDADLDTVQPGRRFSVRGPRNARLNQLTMEMPLPGKQGPRRLKRPGLLGPPTTPMGWEIVNVDPSKWIVTARDRRTQRVAKFQAHPEAFTGFRFRADLHSIGKGQGFSIVTPNDVPMSNCATLLELKR